MRQGACAAGCCCRRDGPRPHVACSAAAWLYVLRHGAMGTGNGVGSLARLGCVGVGVAYRSGKAMAYSWGLTTGEMSMPLPCSNSSSNSGGGGSISRGGSAPKAVGCRGEGGGGCRMKKCRPVQARCGRCLAGVWNSAPPLPPSYATQDLTRAHTSRCSRCRCQVHLVHSACCAIPHAASSPQVYKHKHADEFIRRAVRAAWHYSRMQPPRPPWHAPRRWQRS